MCRIGLLHAVKLEADSEIWCVDAESFEAEAGTIQPVHLPVPGLGLGLELAGLGAASS